MKILLAISVFAAISIIGYVIYQYKIERPKAVDKFFKEITEKLK